MHASFHPYSIKDNILAERFTVANEEEYSFNIEFTVIHVVMLFLLISTMKEFNSSSINSHVAPTV